MIIKGQISITGKLALGKTNDGPWVPTTTVLPEDMSVYPGSNVLLDNGNVALISRGSGTAGEDAQSSLISFSDRLEFSFNRIRSGNWYDDDLTDGMLTLTVVFGEDPSVGDADRTNTSWSYGRPYFYQGTPPPTPYTHNHLTIMFRHNVANTTNISHYSLSSFAGNGFGWSDSNPMNRVSDWEEADYNGTNIITVRVEKKAGNTITVTTLSNDTVREEYSFVYDLVPTPQLSTGGFILHYHNYNRATATEALNNFMMQT